MPKFYCEYCGIYLTHSSPSGRKQHSHGRKHINNKVEYYSQFLIEQTQSKLLNSNSGSSNYLANPYQRQAAQQINVPSAGITINPTSLIYLKRFKYSSK